MNIVFIKGAGKFDQMQTIRPGHSPTVIDCPKQGIIPHDMVHYAVEHTLDVRGFLARVREGEAADFQMQGEPLSDAVERLVEVVQGDQWSGSLACNGPDRDVSRHLRCKVLPHARHR